MIHWAAEASEGAKAEASAGAEEGIYFCEAFNIKSTDKVLRFEGSDHIQWYNAFSFLTYA